MQRRQYQLLLGSKFLVIWYSHSDICMTVHKCCVVNEVHVEAFNQTSGHILSRATHSHPTPFFSLTATAAGISWQRIGSTLPRWLVPVDALLPCCMDNSIQHAAEALQEDKPPQLRFRAEDMRLVQQSLDVRPLHHSWTLCLKSFRAGILTQPHPELAQPGRQRRLCHEAPTHAPDPQFRRIAGFEGRHYRRTPGRHPASKARNLRGFPDQCSYCTHEHANKHHKLANCLPSMPLVGTRSKTRREVGKVGKYST